MQKLRPSATESIPSITSTPKLLISIGFAIFYNTDKPLNNQVQYYIYNRYQLICWTWQYIHPLVYVYTVVIGFPQSKSSTIHMYLRCYANVKKMYKTTCFHSPWLKNILTLTYRNKSLKSLHLYLKYMHPFTFH